MELGKNYRLKVEDPETPDSYITVGGEQRLSFSSSPDTIDASSKDDGNYKVEFYGQQKIALTVAGKVKLPDAGLSALDAAAKGSATISVKIVNTKGAGSDVFECVMNVGNRQVDFDDQQAANYSFSLSLAAAPTTDSLFG
jgi:predicted secreted protein